jgi:anhydro-N-acetylmuramic acid kinase
MLINNLVNKKTKKILGLMSGTSCDGLDMALIDVVGFGLKTSYKLIGSGHYKYNDRVKKMLFGIMTPGNAGIKELSQVNFYLAKIWAKAINTFLKDQKLSPNKIDLIGSHGHTIYHHPQFEPVLDQKISSTWQMGDPSVIAQLTGITTVGDFRVADVALGGQGAPLVPYFDWLSFAHLKENIIALNIGGIANLTYVSKNGDPADIVAFDTGPGNMLIDQLMMRLYEKPMDKDGKIAFAGGFSERLFNYLLKIDDYLEMSPPKSTGREHYNEKFIIDLLRKAVRWRIREPDIIHTVSKYTAFAVWHAYDKFIKSNIDKLFVAGGGSHNKFLMQMLAEYFDGVPVQNVRDAGIDEDYKEAICFAILANECLHGVATGMPNVTGSNRSAILGKICQV